MIRILRQFLGLLFVVLTCASARAQITIMPLGDSGTDGVDYYTITAGGYRDYLVRDLAQSGINFITVGATNDNATPYLTSANDAYHNGYGFYTIDDIRLNLNGNYQPTSGAGNQGGYWITGGNGTGRSAVAPTVILLEIGANDVIYQVDPQTTNPTQTQFEADMEGRLNTLVTTLHSLTPNSIIVVAQIYPFNNATTFDQEIVAYNAYIKNTLVPSLSYTRTVDNYTPFLTSTNAVNSALIGTDNVHPTRYGYPILAMNFAAAVESIEGVSPAKYALTVNNGTGGGSYPAGTVVTVDSNAPASGYQFSSWSSGTGTFDNTYWPIAAYVTPAAASTVTANYAATGSASIPNGTYLIQGDPPLFQFPFVSGLYMGAAAVTSGSPVQVQSYSGGTLQQWVVTNLGSNNVELSLPSTNLAIGVVGASTSAGAYLDVETYTGATSQQWTITQILGTTELVNVKSGMAINITGYYSVSGTQLSQYTAGYIDNQLWAFYPVGVSSPTLASAVSSEVQGIAGTFNLPLALTGTPTIECRRGATVGKYSLVMTFSQPVTSLSATLGLQAGQTGTVVGTAQTPVISGSTVTVGLTGVGDAQRLNLQLSNIQPGGGTASVPFSVLWGNVKDSGVVSSLDYLVTRSEQGSLLNATTFQYDVNCDGTISSGDAVLVRSLSGTFLP